jgi:Na+-transporting NADH:ubiquinone oxidoreductase subunit NqrB
MATVVTIPAVGAVQATPAESRRAWDPRLYQIATLGGLLVYGVVALDLEVHPLTAVTIVATALVTQRVGARLAGRSPELASALISALSLCLLLRTDAPALGAVAAALAIGSKFVLRVGGKHVFNPTNLALVVLLAATGQVWVSPGQWGSGAVFAFLLAAAGGVVVNRAARADVSGMFLAAHAALVLGHAAWLGDPLAIPWHRLQNGALVLFAFFMISDPRTTPDSRAGRILFALLVAVGAHVVQFRLFWTNPLLWSLAACSLVVPLLDRLLPGPRHQWRRQP